MVVRSSSEKVLGPLASMRDTCAWRVLLDNFRMPGRRSLSVPTMGDVAVAQNGDGGGHSLGVSGRMLWLTTFALLSRYPIRPASAVSSDSRSLLWSVDGPGSTIARVPELPLIFRNASGIAEAVVPGEIGDGPVSSGRGMTGIDPIVGRAISRNAAATAGHTC